MTPQRDEREELEFGSPVRVVINGTLVGMGVRKAVVTTEEGVMVTVPVESVTTRAVEAPAAEACGTCGHPRESHRHFDLPAPGFDECYAQSFSCLCRKFTEPTVPARGGTATPGVASHAGTPGTDPGSAPSPPPVEAEEQALGNREAHVKLLCSEVARLRGELHKERDNTLVAAQMKREGDVEIERLRSEIAALRASRGVVVAEGVYDSNRQTVGGERLLGQIDAHVSDALDGEIVSVVVRRSGAAKGEGE